MRVVAGEDGWPAAFEYAVGGQTVRFVQTSQIPPILHRTLFHPTDDITACAHRGGGRALDSTMPQAPGTRLSSTTPRGLRAPLSSERGGRARDDAVQFERLKEEFEKAFSAKQAGRPLCSKAGSTGSRCRSLRRTWISRGEERGGA